MHNDPKMVRKTLNILQQILQNCQSVYDHFRILYMKELKVV